MVNNGPVGIERAKKVLGSLIWGYKRLLKHLSQYKIEMLKKSMFFFLFYFQRLDSGSAVRGPSEDILADIKRTWMDYFIIASTEQGKTFLDSLLENVGRLIKLQKLLRVYSMSERACRESNSLSVNLVSEWR